MRPFPSFKASTITLGAFRPSPLSDSGTVAYLPAERVHEAELVWLDRAGNVTPLPGARANIFFHFRLSPDGRAVGVTLSEGGQSSVWIFDLERGTRRLIAEPDSYGPIWSRDGAFIIY